MASDRIEFSLRGIGTELKARRLAVPIYQRSFASREEEAAEFFDDLKTAFSDESPEYSLGTLVAVPTKRGGHGLRQLITMADRVTSWLDDLLKAEYRFA